MKSIKLLLVSDLHLQFDFVQKLIEIEKNNTFDFILLLGDFLNLNHTPQENEQIDDLTKLIQPFKLFNCKRFLIPGNHDPECLFQQKDLFEGFTNIHKKTINLTQNIMLVGLGGSIPGYTKNEMIWQGYPYQNEEQYEKDIQDLQFDKEKQVILMSHIGPSISQTTISFENGQENQIQSGSSNLTKLINNNKNIILNVHGHTHDGIGTRRVENCKIVNVGPLLYGNYCIITISSKIDSIEHKFI